MLYEKIYDSIIERAKNRTLDGYSEKHHIIPKCMGGLNTKENIVKLTFREHFICHQLLCKIYPKNEKLIFAFSTMIRASHKNYERFDILTSRHFEIVKKVLAPYQGKWNKGKIPWNKGMRGEEYKAKFKEGSLIPPSMTGRRWINDGKIQAKLAPNTELPAGWSFGRLDIKGDNNPMRKNKNGV